MVTIKLMWALLLIIPSVLSGPLLSNSCASECRTPLNPKFRYGVGHTYTHTFQANSKTWLMGTSDDQAVLEVKGQALVTFRAPCDAVLQLRQTTITGLTEKVDASELEKRPILFSWQDGTVDKICSDESDPAWVLNIKRSVLSMLQHTAQFVDVSENNVVESDVIGRCPTKYIVESAAGKSVKITKTKIPNQCSERIGRHSSIPTVEYNVPAETQTIPLLNSTSVCQQHIEGGVVKSTECRESHLFRPLSSETNGGARTEVTSSISLTATANTGASVKIPSGNLETSTLILDPLGVQAEKQGVKDVNAVVRALCLQLNADSPVRVSQLFTELVHSLRKASPKEVKAAHATLKATKICPESVKTEKLFLDALPQAGSTGTIALMAELLKENQVSERQALGWYISLPLSKFVSLDAIKAVVPLVEKASNSPVALLGLSGLARRHCIHHKEECQSSPDVQQLSKNIGKLLGNKCQVDLKDEVKVIAALKALGNLGVMVQEVRTTVSQCVKDERLPMPIRLAAVEATRSNPCDKEGRETLLSVLEDKNEETEIRIAAYQGVMRCADSPALLRIQQVLTNEEYNQVGSYINSHLENLRKSSSPGKKQQRRLAEKVTLERSFPSDLRKYSRNLANSAFCPINNVGWDVDANLIYATKSFIPRSASMNLTLDLFGQSVNLFEVGVRAENLEHILEAFLGPDAVDKEGVVGLLQKAGDSVSQFGNNVWSRLSSITRSKRATIRTNELTNLDKMVTLKDKNSGIKMDAFLRVFGSEVGMVNYRGATGERKLEVLSNLESKIADAWRDLIQGAKQVNIDVARSLMFLDTSATFPTVAGFPLRLSINGTTTVGLGLESQMDVKALLRDPLNSNVHLKMSPLAVTELSAAMTVDIAVVRTGIKMAATVHSSMAADFSARLQQGTAVEVKLDLPKSKITLVDFSSKVMLIEQSVDKDERSKPLNILSKKTYERGGCSERLTPITGLRLCASSSLTVPRPLSDPSMDPAPAFPLSGSGSFAIVLEKTEPSMKGYLLSASLKQEGPKSTSFVMSLDTPGSQTNRKVSVKGTLTSAPTWALKVDSKAPWGSLAVEGEMVDREDAKSVQVKLTTQDKREFFGKWQMNIARADRKYTYTTSVEAGWPNQPKSVILEGKFGHVVGSSVEISIKPAGPYASWPLSLQGTVTREFSASVQKIALSNFQLTTPLGKTMLSTEIGHQDKTYSTNFNMKYGTEQKLHSVNLNAKVQSVPVQTDDAVSYKTVVSYKSSRFPKMNMDLKWDVQGSPSLLSNTLTLVHGQESEQSTNRLYINQYSLLTGQVSKNDLTMENKLEATYPRYAINFKFDQNLKLDKRALKGLLNLQVDNNRVIDSDLSIVFVPKDSKNIYELNAKLVYPGRTITLTDIGKKIDANSFAISPVLEIQPGTKIELDGKASLILDQNGVSINLDSELRNRQWNSPIRLTHSFQRTRDMTMTTSNKIEWDGKSQLVLNGKSFLRTPAMPAVELTFLWNGRVDGKLDARVSKDESKIDLDVDLTRLQRRIKVNSEHKTKGDSRSGSLSVAWDADKDPSKQIGLDGSLSLSLPQRSIEVKSTLNVQSRVYSSSLSGKWGAEILNGDHSLRVDMQLPSSKKAYVSINLSNVNQARKLSNRLDVETLLLSGNLHQTTINNVVTDLDRSAYTYTAVTDLSYKATNVEEMKWRMESKRSVKGDKRSIEFKSLVVAPKWGQNIDGTLNLEVSRDSFRASSKYQRGSNLITVESVGKISRQGSKTNVDGFVELKAPKTWLQQSKIAVVSAYDITDIRNFDISEKISVVYQNTKTITLDTNVKISPASADVSLMLETPYQAARRQGLTLSGRVDLSNPRIRQLEEGSLVVIWSSPDNRQPQEARIDMEAERRPGQQLRFKLTTSSPLENFESSELSIDGRRLQDGQVMELDLVAGVGDKKGKLSGRVSLVPSQRELDVTLNLERMNPMRFLARVSSQAPTHTVHTRVDWGNGVITVEGTVKYVNVDNVEVSLVINSPELDINNFELKASNKLQKKERIIELSVLNKSVVMASFKSVYDRKETSTGVEVSGKAEINIVEANMSGSVNYVAEQRRVQSTEEQGKEYKLRVEVTAGSIPMEEMEIKLKVTNKDKSGSISVCGVMLCREGSFAYKRNDNGVEAHILTQRKDSTRGMQHVQGLRLKHVVTPGKFEQSVEVLFNEVENRLIGYKAYKNDKEIAVELYTPKRMSRAVLEISRPAAGRQAGKAQYILTVWLDKTKAPERKLVVATTVEPHSLGDLQGHSVSILVKHPILPRELDYKMELHAGKDALHVKLDIDSLDTKHKRWTLESRMENSLGKGRVGNLNFDAEVRSKGAEVAAQLVINLSATDKSRALGAVLQLKDKERVVKDFLLRVDATRQSASLAIGSSAKQLNLEGRWNVDHIVGYSRFQLSGSSRIFGLSPTVVVLDMNTSPHIDIRIFNKDTPENFHQITGGLLDAKRFEVAVVRQLNVQRKELAALHLHLNSSTILSTRLNWKLEDLRGLLTIVRSRSQSIRTELRDITSSLTTDLSPTLAKWRASESMQSGYSKLVAEFRKQLKEMKVEAEQDESLKEVAVLMQKVARVAETITGAIQEVLDIFDSHDMIDNIVDAISVAKERLEAVLENAVEIIVDLLRSLNPWKESSGQQSRLLRDILAYWEKKCDELEQIISEVRDKIDARLSKLSNWIESLNLRNNKIVVALRELISNANMDTICQRAITLLEETILLPVEETLNEWVVNYPELTRVVYRYGQVPLRKIREYLKTTSKQTQKVLSSQPSLLSTKNLLKSYIGEVVVYDIKNGEIRYNIPLYEEVSSLRDLARRIQSRASALENLPPATSSLKSVYHGLRSQYDPTLVGSRLNGFASSIGNTGFITFDKRSFNVRGGCQYLLARDFLNQDFAVAVNFDERNGDKSIIFTDGVDQVEVKNEARQVLINSKPTTASQTTLKNIQVKIIEDTVVVKRSSGVVLRCNMVSDVCTFELSPFYSGRTMGLWGTFSNEHADDMVEPSGKLSSRGLSSFVNSWKLNKNCRDNISTVTKKAFDSRQCSDFEDKSSRLSSCFRAVSPAPYHELCLEMGSTDLKPRVIDFQRQLNSLLQGYLQACERAGVAL